MSKVGSKVHTDYFQDKRILITGASRGLGRVLALECARLGGKIVALARNEESLKLLQKDIAFIPGNLFPEIYVCDLTKQSELSEVLTRAMPIDLAILNAGIKYSNEKFFSSEQILETMEVNFLAVVRILDLLLPAFAKKNSGHLVFISSLGGYHGMIRASGYNASKAALSIMADSLRMDLFSLGKNIKVTVVKPGLIQTEMVPSQTLKGLKFSKERAARIILKGVAKGKEEIVFPKLMYFLALFVSLLPKRWSWRLFKWSKP